MNKVITYVQQHLSLRLGLLISAIVAGVFGVSMGLLFYDTKQYVRKAAVRHATQVLNQTVISISDILQQTEGATCTMERRASAHLQPDTLLAYTRQILAQNEVMQGFTIALEPHVLSDDSHRFTAYSYRSADSIVTIAKNDYDYFAAPWYKTPMEQKTGCWLDPYLYAVPGIDAVPVNYFSFTTPLYGPDGRLIGVVCSDLSLRWLSQAVSGVKPFPNSSAIMLSHDGHYIVHPDPAKIMRESIFSDPDPEARDEVVALGHSMLSGQSGEWSMTVDGHPAHLFYRPLQRTGWSIAIVCPDSDVFNSYNRMLSFVWGVILVFLLLLLLFCYLTIRRAIVPVNQLAVTVRSIADGAFDTPLPQSRRVDTVGRVQNSFVQMQQALDVHPRRRQGRARRLRDPGFRHHRGRLPL